MPKCFRLNKKILRECEIYKMLRLSSRRRHLSFHTPGHKVGKWDLTELSFSDNLSSPKGCILAAEKAISRIFGSYRSFLCTDGSTAGVLSLLYAAKEAGVKRVAILENSHKSVYNGCWLLGLEQTVIAARSVDGIPLPPTVEELKIALQNADALFLTSPDYYGNIADLKGVRELCDQAGKLLLIDGAHGGHLHFDRDFYAGSVADLWVDGVHKSLPALTQGAVVSARTEALSDLLLKGLDIFRTTSPSYPIMASIEYAARFPRNERLENEVLSYLKENFELFYFGGDWTKLCLKAGALAFELEKELEKQGIYAEFCDGNAIVFYLSPATTLGEFKRLKKALRPWLERLKENEKNTVQRNPAPFVFEKTDEKTEIERVDLEKAQGRICARVCGLFPPCTPLVAIGERFSKEKLELLKKADNSFGLDGGKAFVFKEDHVGGKEE